MRLARLDLSLARLFGCLLAAAGIHDAMAQQSGSAMQDVLPLRRGSGAPELSQFELPPQTQPATPAPAPAHDASPRPLPAEEPAFVLKGVQVDGNSVLDQSDLDHVTAPFIGRPVRLRDLEQIRQGITLLYVNRGYINSGAIIPDQTVDRGILQVKVVEGHLTGIELTGTRYYRPSYLTDRLARGVSVPLNVNDLAREQQILLRDPFLSRLNLNIAPGLSPGEARLTGEVTENPPYGLTAQIANDQSPTVGEVRGQLQGVIGNLLGVGDVLAAEYGRSEALNDGAISYSVPISSDDTRVSIRYDINSNQVESASLSALNITSRYQSIGVGINRPFYRTPEQELVLGLSLEWREDQTYLLNQPFSFIAGSDKGRTDVTALRFYQSWLDQNAERVMALRSTFSIGLDALGATVTAEKPSGQFFVWLGQAQYVRRFFNDWEGLIRGSLQLSNDPLFPIEQFVLGGMSTVRGYREYLTAADNAFAGTLELRVPVYKVLLPGVSASETAGTVQLAPFFDHGAGWNTGRNSPPDANLSSLGIGVRWLIKAGVLAEIYYGHGFRPVHVGNSLQDQGVHFRVTANLF